MSTTPPLARSPRPSAGPAPTRQQLDELDALLQRMLELPVHQGEDGDEEARLPDIPLPRKAAPPPPPPPRVAQAPTPARAAPMRAEARPAEPSLRRESVPPPPPPAADGPRSYPASYMVVETSTPSYLTQPGRDAGADAGLGPRMLTPQVPPSAPGFDLPVPGGRHDLEADDPIDPAEELARMKAELEAPPEDWVPFQSSWQPSEQTWKPLAESWEQARVAPPADLPIPPPPREAANRPRAPTRPANEQGAVPPPPRTAPRDLPRPTGAPSGPVVVTQTAAPLEAPPVAQPVYRPPVAPPVFSYPAAEGQPAQAAARTSPAVARPAARPDASPAPRPAATPVMLYPLVAFNVVFDVFLMPWGPPGRWLRGKSGRNFLATVGVLCLLGAAALAVADGYGIGWNW